MSILGKRNKRSYPVGDAGGGGSLRARVYAVLLYPAVEHLQKDAYTFAELLVLFLFLRMFLL